MIANPLHPRPSALAAAGLLCLGLGVSSAPAAEKWDMPAGYSAKNFITSAYIEFAKAVTANSNGDLEIVVHPSGSLYKASEILRAVRSGQVAIGGRYIGAHGNPQDLAAPTAYQATDAPDDGGGGGGQRTAILCGGQRSDLQRRRLGRRRQSEGCGRPVRA